ncbi:MAG: hypothetical protein ACMVY4_03500 [Minwuia sp.]|uniref:hypothetical protein n=1 Tax=Minwuia sp. TaxID=2493630 RepID=UPI003A873FAD
MVLALGNFLPQRGEAPPSIDETSAGASRPGPGPKEDDGFGFWDLVDVVNPLQHIPIVSSIYRHYSGDEIGAPARLAGGFLFGGFIGLASSAANLGIEMATGEDVGAHVMNALDPGEAHAAPGARLQLASARAADAYAAGAIHNPRVDLPA